MTGCSAKPLPSRSVRSSGARRLCLTVFYAAAVQSSVGRLGTPRVLFQIPGRHWLPPLVCSTPRFSLWMWCRLTGAGQVSKRLPFVHAHKLGNFCGFETKNHRAGHIF